MTTPSRAGRPGTVARAWRRRSSLARPPGIAALFPALLLALAACEPGPPPEGEPAAGGDTASRGTEPADPPAEPPEATSPDPVTRWAARLPDSLRHRAGACPFECCVYREWTPTGPVPLRGEPRRTAALVDTIPAGEAFRADSGFVRVTGTSVVAVTEAVEAGPTTFDPGDTLVVLDWVGEGFVNVWDGRDVWEVSGFWGAGVGRPRGLLVGGDRYAREWWVHATRSDGRRGWLDADAVARLDGADACS